MGGRRAVVGSPLAGCGRPTLTTAGPINFARRRDADADREGAFASITGVDPLYRLRVFYDGGSDSYRLDFTVAPEPAAALAGPTGLGLLAARRRRV